MTTIVTSDRLFTPEMRRSLALLSDMMIPSSHNMPSAADVEIFRRTEVALDRHQDLVIGALGKLEELSRQSASSSFVDLGSEARDTVVAEFKKTEMDFVSIFQSIVLASYYRDDRVLRELGLPDRAPYPLGHSVDETDWSLLDPVRGRPSFFRVVDGEGG